MRCQHRCRECGKQCIKEKDHQYLGTGNKTIFHACLEGHFW